MTEATDLKVLVTGGAGYLGSMLCRLLVSHGITVVVIDDLIHGQDSLVDLLVHDRFQFVRCDIRDTQKMKAWTNRVDAVVHLAAIVGDPACKRSPELARTVNLEATQSLIDLSKSGGAGKFIFASTCSNYGISDPEQLVPETAPLAPQSLYAETKVACEKYLNEANDDEFTGVVLRFSTLFGLSSRMRFDLVINQFTAEAISDGRIEVYNPALWRPYLHTCDAARAILECLVAQFDREQQRVFNVGTDENNYSKAQIATKIAEHFPQTEIAEKEVAEDPRTYRVDFSRWRENFGWTPQVTVDRGIEQIGTALQEGLIRNWRDPKYRNSP